MSVAESSYPRVLIAEDESELLEALRDMIESKGYEVVAATTQGGEAVDIAHATKPDLALLDYRLPGVDGVAITRAIKATSPNTQIIMFTAYDEMSLSIDATQAGVFAFLVKGCPPSLIIQALESAWEFKQELDAAGLGAAREN
jgi:DNA-binding NarL/FixJ family response regulator